MRTVVVILVVAGLGGLYAWQKKGGESSEPAVAAQSVHVAASPAPAASPTREVSEHNWMKRSLDRAKDVRDQARTSTRDNQNP